MAWVEVDYTATKRILRWAQEYAEKNDRCALCMGIALMLAGFTLVSAHTDSIAFEQILDGLKERTARLRVRQAN